MSDDVDEEEEAAVSSRRSEEPPSAQQDAATDERPPAWHAWLIAGGVTAASTVAISQAFRPDRGGTMSVLAIMAALYVLGIAASWIWLSRRGELKRKLAPNRGDVTFGALIACGMYLAGVGAHLFLTSRGSPQAAWLYRVYLQIGDPKVTGAFIVGPIILAIAAAEELTWRGLVQGALEEAHGKRVALIATALLYAGCHLPTIYLLRDPIVGWNPLVVLAALGGGLVWGWLAMRFERVALGLFAHALFSWAIVEFPIMNM
jgi:uncharacterized protein